ncbi:hypothetical protein [Kitasatospora sp. NPDC048407]|uniref:hypothetical protein n=1 Tax=Kitasatospora sp. NPDC048407 TaxID=3364051 RepID=UPI0037113E79
MTAKWERYVLPPNYDPLSDYSPEKAAKAAPVGMRAGWRPLGCCDSCDRKAMASVRPILAAQLSAEPEGTT